MSLHFLFRSEDHLVKAVADPAVVKAVREMIDDTVQGAHVLAVTTLGLRNIYSKREVKKIRGYQGHEGPRPGDADGRHDVPRLRRANVHMPFGNVSPRCRPAWSTRRERRQRLSGEQALRGWRRSCR